MKDKETNLKENLGIIAGIVSPKTKARIYVAATVGMILTTIITMILMAIYFKLPTEDEFLLKLKLDSSETYSDRLKEYHEAIKYILAAAGASNGFFLIIQQTFNGKNYKEVFKK